MTIESSANQSGSPAPTARSPLRSMSLAIRPRLTMVVLAIAWTIIAGVSLAWNLQSQQDMMVEAATIQARAAFDKDVLYREWNTMHGGVYVPVTGTTPPNPFLSVADREIETPSGLMLTKINPAYMTRQVHELGAARTGIQGHLTSLNPIRPGNIADAWETSALMSFENGATEYHSIETYRGEEYMRLMRPLVTGAACLSCHAVQGYTEGSIRGGISASIPMAPIREGAHAAMISITAWHGGLWFVVLGGIGFSHRLLHAQAHEQLVAQKFQRALFESSPDSMYVLNQDMTIRMQHNLSPECGRQEPVRESALSVVPADHHDAFRAAFDRVLETRELQTLETTAHEPDGKAHFLHRLNPLPDTDDGQAVMLVVTDITEGKKLEHRLIQAQKLESIGQLAAGIAHEINTPIQYVGDNTRFVRDSVEKLMELIARCGELLESDPATRESTDPEPASAFHQMIEEYDLEFVKEEIPKAIEQTLSGVNRVSEIVRAMKDFSHPGGESKKSVALNKAIASTITVCRSRWKYIADLETDFDESLPPIPCLLGELNQVFLNIIVNAADAINTHAENGGPGKGTITVTTRRAGEFIEIRIKDTGGGIPADIQQKIFEPFFTTKEVGQGTGQGLAISHDVIVTKHGGTLDFEVDAGCGTTFVIRLPLTDHSANTQKVAA